MDAKFCINCGTQLPNAEAKFCANCGAAQSDTLSQTTSSPGSYSPQQAVPQQEMVQCPQCRGKGKVSFRKCDVCSGTGQVSLQRRELHTKETNSKTVVGLVVLAVIIIGFVALLWGGKYIFGTTSDFSGTWSGTIANSEGSSTYTMNITQIGSSVTGTATLRKGTESASFNFIGTVDGDTLSFTDTRVTNLTPLPDGRYWCKKTGSLHISASGNSLSGSWTAVGCVPGTLSLIRQ